MTNEQRERANEIQARLVSLRNTIKMWEDRPSPTDFCAMAGIPPSRKPREASWAIIRTILISDAETEMKNLQKEMEEL